MYTEVCQPNVPIETPGLSPSYINVLFMPRFVKK